MGDYNELLEQFNSLSNAYSKLRANSAVEEKKAKTRFETCKYIIIILAFAALYFGTSSIGKVPKPDYAFSTEEYTQSIQSTREKAYADGLANGQKLAETNAEKLASQKYDEGYAEGYQIGYDDGMDDGVLSSSESYEMIGSAWSDAYDIGYAQALLEIGSGETVNTASVEPVETYDYIINTNTGKFHYTWCSSVSKMSESNKWYYSGTRDSVTDMGYIPCKRCSP